MHPSCLGFLILVAAATSPITRDKIPDSPGVGDRTLPPPNPPPSIESPSWGGSIGALSRSIRAGLAQRRSLQTTHSGRRAIPIASRPARTGQAPSAATVENLPTVLWFGSATPNPAHGQVAFRLDLPTASHVRLTVHDVAGRLVDQLESYWPAGRHVLTWNGQAADRAARHAGVYFAHLSVDGRPLGNRRIVLLQ
jgi:hypothetical protein